MKKNGLTIFEDIIIVVIILLVFWLMILPFMTDEDKEKAKQGYRKAFHAVEKAVRKDYEKYGSPTDCDQIDGNFTAQILKNHMNVVEDYGNRFKTADGMFYDVQCGYVEVNINGVEGYGEWFEDLFKICIDHERRVNTCGEHQQDKLLEN